MDFTKDQLIDSILIFAKVYESEESYKWMLSSSNLPEVVKCIVYDLFLNRFIDYFAEDKLYFANKIIHEYAKELQLNGFVEFLPENYLDKYLGK